MHVSYALFANMQDAGAAVDRVQALGDVQQRCSVVVHNGRLDEGMLHVSESDAAAGARRGAALGAILGAAAGAAAMGPIGLASGGALGAAFGLMSGAIAGSSGPDRRLTQFSKELADGKVLVVVESPSFAYQDRADGAMRANRGHVEHKPFF